MAKTRFIPHQIGKYQRVYDKLSEDDGDEQKLAIADVLKWMEVEVPLHGPSRKSEKSRALQDLIEAGIALERVNKIGAIAALQASPHHGTLIERGIDVLRDLYFSARDLLAGKKVKTSLFVTVMIALGAAAGFAIGTFLLPGVGSAIGGYVGGAIASGLAAIGGAIGTTIIGAFLGSWIGKKIAAKIFKKEKRFELSKKETGKIKRHCGVNSQVAEMMNGYLYNRRKTCKSELCQKYYRMLRKKAIYDADPIAMEKVAQFFCHELSLLELERDTNPDDPALKTEIDAVVFILNHLQTAKGLDKKTRAQIQSVMEDYERRQMSNKSLPKNRLSELRRVVGETTDDMALDESLPKRRRMSFGNDSVPSQAKRESIEYHSVVPTSRQMMGQMKDSFVESLRDSPHQVKKVQVIDDNDFSSQTSYRYHIETQRHEALPDIVFQESKRSASHFVTEVAVDGKNLNSKNQSVVVAMMVEQARIFHQRTGNVSITVYSGGNDAFAIEVMAALKQEGFEPTLNEEEYPDVGQAQKARRQHIHEQADILFKTQEGGKRKHTIRG